MNIQVAILLVSGFINLVMSVFIFSRGIKNKVNLYFSLLTFFNFLWAVSLLVFDFVDSEDLLKLSASLPYTAAWLIAIYLFYFSVEFPYRIFDLSKLYKWIINSITFVVVIYTTVFYRFFVPNVAIVPEHIAYYRTDFYIVYTIFFAFFMLLTIFIFIKKYNLAEGIAKIQLRLMLITVILGIVFGSYFDLFLIYFDIFRWIYLGPLFTLFINFAAFYSIFLLNKNAK